jgi:O-antigen/teichoic acid export membrane protein
VLARLVLAVVTAVSIPLLLGHLGATGYGIWATLTAGVAWLALAQFGLGPALLNRLSALAGSSSWRSVAWTSWWMSLALGVAVFVCLAGALRLLPWTDFLRIEPGHWATEAQVAAIALAVGVAGGIPASVPLAVLRARQEVYVANAIEAAAAIARLLALIALVSSGASLGALATGSTLAGLGVVAIAGFAAARGRMAFGAPLRPVLSEARGLLRGGSAFTSVSLAALLIMYTDAIVISQALGPSAVPAYVAAFTLLTFFMSLGLAILDATWPGMTEAAAAGDWTWLRRSLDRLVVLGVVGASTFALVLVLQGPAIIDLWVGPEARPPAGLLPVLAAIALVQAIELPHGRLLISMGRLRAYASFGLANAALNLVLSVFLVRILGVTGVAVATLLGYLVFAPPLVLLARRALTAAAGSSRSAASKEPRR